MALSPRPTQPHVVLMHVTLIIHHSCPVPNSGHRESKVWPQEEPEARDLCTVPLALGFCVGSVTSNSTKEASGFLLGLKSRSVGSPGSSSSSPAAGWVFCECGRGPCGCPPPCLSLSLSVCLSFCLSLPLA
jgi:hypothetical protein